jgi:predicted transcriptional regulator
LGFTNALLKNGHMRKPERADMQRSKLELYGDVLTALADKHLTVDAIAYACSMDCFALHHRLKFLLKNGLVEERHYNKKTRYALTRRGLAIYKTLALTKHLEKLQTNMKKINEALQTLPSLSEHGAENATSEK